MMAHRGWVWRRLFEGDSLGGIAGRVHRNMIRHHPDPVLTMAPHLNETRLPAFSCKGRGFCPSCGGRRIEDGTAHLCNRVLTRSTATGVSAEPAEGVEIGR